MSEGKVRIENVGGGTARFHVLRDGDAFYFDVPRDVLRCVVLMLMDVLDERERVEEAGDDERRQSPFPRPRRRMGQGRR